MQKGEKANLMPPKTPNASDPEAQVAFLQSKSIETPEFKKPCSPEKSKDQNGLKRSHLVDDEASSTSTTAPTKSDGTLEDGRERLKRHRVEVAGRVWIPEMWGQEGLLKDWIDCAAFDASLANSGIMSARASLVEQGRKPISTDSSN